MDLSKPIVLDGILWSPNTLDIEDILTPGRNIIYKSEKLQKTLHLLVTKCDHRKCNFWCEDEKQNYAQLFSELIIENISIK